MEGNADRNTRSVQTGRHDPQSDVNFLVHTTHDKSSLSKTPMLLPSLVRTRPIPSTTEVPEETEDVFESALSTIFTDDLTVQHGNEGTEVIYRSVDHGDIVLRLAELDSSSDGEEARKKFAHYVWNSGVLMGDLVAGRPSRSAESHGQGDAAKRPVEIEDSEWGVRAFAEGRDWWIEEDEQPFWLAEGRRVIELGAGA